MDSKKRINQKNLWRKRVTLSCVGVIAVIGIVVSTLFMMKTEPAVAAMSSDKIQKCLNESGAPDVKSVQDACKLCSSGARGALWFNSSSTDRNSNTIYAKEGDKEIDVYLWGQTYGCDRKCTNIGGCSPSIAGYIWFADAGQMMWNGTGASPDTRRWFLYADGRPNDERYNITLYRGTLANTPYKWYNGTGNNVKLKLNIDVFTRIYIGEMGRGSVKTAEDGTKTYTADISVNRCFTNNGLDVAGIGRHYYNMTNTQSGPCYGEDSTITLVVEPAKEQARFESWSYGSATAGNREIQEEFNTFHVNGDPELTPDDKEERTVRTTEEKVNLFFSHQFSYFTPINELYDYSGDVYTTYDHVIEVTTGDKTEKIYESNNNRLYVRKPDFEANVNRPVNIDTAMWTRKDFVHSDPEITLEIGETKKVCSTVTYSKKWIKFDGYGNQVKFNNDTSSGKASTTACMIVKRGASLTNGSEFTSRSYVKTPEVALENYTQPSQIEASQIDGMLAIAKVLRIIYGNTKPTNAVQAIIGRAGYAFVEVDSDTISVDFWHNLYYTPDNDPETGFQFTEKDVVPDVSTNWTATTRIKRFDAEIGSEEEQKGWNVTQNKKYKESGWSVIDGPTKGTWTLSGSNGEPKTKQTSADLAAINKEIESPKPGDYAFVCSTIQYEPKYVKLKQSEDIDKNKPHTESSHDYYKYTIEKTGGFGSSEACVLIYRKLGVVGTPTNGDNNNTLGKVVTDPMYVGEETTVGWYTEADSAARNSSYGWLGRILIGYQAVNCVVPANGNIASLGSLFSGSSNAGAEPKDYYVGAGASVGCEVAYSQSWGDGDNSHRANANESIVAPNEVGRKDCTGAGYKYKYCYVYCPPVKDAKCYRKCDPPWWETYGAVCRPTAKKPTVSVWNGGIFIGSGSIKTSIAERYTDKADIIYTLLRDGGNSTQFGAWSEYLATINGGITNFTSGGVLATGLPGQSFNLIDNSPLTIQNANNPPGPGHSQIQSNSVLLARMKEYFFSHGDIIEYSGGAHTSAMGLDGIGTKFIKVKGDLNIDSDIVNQDSSNNTVYGLPQTVIYATGDINITGNNSGGNNAVQRIDAWLITDGTINTCKEATTYTAAMTKDYPSYQYSQNCANNLQFNGPVFAKNIKLYRTYGADGISNDDEDKADNRSEKPLGTEDRNLRDDRAATAENFNLSADTYLWAYAQAGRYSSSYTEAYSRELPPRY